MSVVRAKTHRIPPVEHATAWRPLGLAVCVDVFLHGQFFSSGAIKRWRNGLLSCYGPVAIERRFAKLRFPVYQTIRSCGWHQSTRRWKLPIVKFHQFEARSDNLSVSPMSEAVNPTCWVRHCVKTVGHKSMPFGIESLLTWPYHDAKKSSS